PDPFHQTRSRHHPHEVTHRGPRHPQAGRHRATSPWLLPALLRTSGLPRRTLRDEAVYLVVAGYETTAVTLAWVLVVLGSIPNIYAGRAAGAPGSAARLAALRTLVSETARLYPVTWLLRRHGIADDVLGGYRITISPYLTHRNPSLWVEPERFAPTRLAGTGHRPAVLGAYYPFSTGSRACLGAQFAQREMPLLLDRLLATATPHLRSSPMPVFGLIIHPDRPVLAGLTPVPP
ncbi:cytochrome P450, partial [Streptomyces sp. NPDC054796]